MVLGEHGFIVKHKAIPQRIKVKCDCEKGDQYEAQPNGDDFIIEHINCTIACTKSVNCIVACSLEASFINICDILSRGIDIFYCIWCKLCFKVEF